jgi:hypothetical protein
MRPGFFNVEFEWPVASSGYRLVKTETAEGVEPTELFYVVTPNGGDFLNKRAFEKFPGLFLEFAHMEPTPEGVLAFASKFGLLQADRENELIWWLQYQRDFAELVALKGRAKLPDTMAPGRRLVSVKLGELEGLQFAMPDSRLGALDRVNRVFQAGITAYISRDGRASGLVVKPTSLLAAMALQLGLWLGAETESIGQCPQCGGTFEKGPGTRHRASRRYCSLKCQEAARYTRRKKGIA